MSGRAIGTTVFHRGEKRFDATGIGAAVAQHAPAPPQAAHQTGGRHPPTNLADLPTIPFGHHGTLPVFPREEELDAHGL